MIEGLPSWIELTFLVAFLTTIILFYYSNGKPKLLTLMICIWAIVHSCLAYSLFYLDFQSTPPRFAFVLIPAIALIIYGLLPKQRKWVLKNRNIEVSTFLHSIRFLVEVVLFGLFTNKMIPELMTYEGRNYDIIMGITSLIVGFLYLKNKISQQILLLWNFVGLFLIVFIFINGILSAPFPFQQFGFEQPNEGVGYFPFILLPAVIVPIVIWTHFTDIFKLIHEIKTN